MEKVTDIAGALQKVLRAHGMEVDCADIFNYVKEIAHMEASRQPGPQGSPGAIGPQGQDGAPGKDAWDKYRWDPNIETMIESRWKGIEFKFPLATCFVEGFPEGELTYGDINYIRTIYGNMVVETMAVFWRRAYDYHTNMQVFLNEEDTLCLNLINKSNSSPAPLRDS